MSVVAKPMICSNFRIGSPLAIGRVATLCPAGMRCAVRTPSPASSVFGQDVDAGDDGVVQGAETDGDRQVGHLRGPPGVLGHI